MKTTEINNALNTKKIAFKGHTAYTTERGRIGHKFYLPFDSTKYSVELELQGFEDINGKWRQIADSEPTKLPMDENGLVIPDELLYTEEGTATGYRFLLTEKNNPNNKFYKIDSGLQSNPTTGSSEHTYALLLPNRTVLSVNGLTKQVMPDITFPGYYINQKTRKIEFNKEERNRAINAVRTHANKLGGNIAGIIKMLPVWKKEGYTKIVGTPYTRDETSSHYYWTENPFQISESMGSMEDFKLFQQELFKNGQNFIADGAFVNQGLQGTLFRSVLKHGEESPFFNWFKAPGLLSSDLKLGAIPSNKEARENFAFRIVNAPIKFTFEDGKFNISRNNNFDKTKLSYVQLFDKRLVNEKELNNSQELLTRYSKTNTDNAYDITGHNDTTQLLTFEINPNKFMKHMQNVTKNTPRENRHLGNQNFVEALLTFDNFRITTKDKGGVDLWDGNMDIAKLNFYVGNTDQAYLDKYTDPYEKAQKTKELKSSIYQVQDFALQAVRYWTKFAANSQIEYAAKTLKNAEPTIMGFKKEIAEQVEKGNLPASAKELMNEDVIKNALTNKYVFDHLKVPEYLQARMPYLENAIMEFPLETIEFSPDLTAVLASPYITKRANNKEELFKNRHEIYAENEIGQGSIPAKYAKTYNKMDQVIVNEFTEYAIDVLNHVESYLDKDQKLFEKNTYKVTNYGKYVINNILPDIIKYAMVRSFAPNAKINFDTEKGIVNYSEANLKDISLKSLDIDGSPEEEASKTVSILKKGLESLGDKKEKKNLVTTLVKRIKPLKEAHFRIADVMIDQTQSGLGWRIDAAKDIANIDALRTRNDNDEKLLKSVIDFWGNFYKVAKEENRHVYTTAEITDFEKIMQTKNGEFGSYVNAETKFIERTGLNNTANYMFFYSMLKNLFARSPEDGILENFDNIEELHKKLAHGWDSGNGDKVCNGFLYQYPDDGIANSYTFLGNHDKPRVLHIFALDMDIFFSDFSNDEHLRRARTILCKNDIKPQDISGKAIAMGERLLGALYNIGAMKYPEDNDTNILKQAIANLANGKFKGKKFNAEAFGTRDFRHSISHVFEEAQYLGYKNSKADDYKNEALRNILEPAMDKFATVYKMLVTLPGSPTDFVGDKEGSSGYETKSNNDFQQNRNAVPFEWISTTLKDENIDNSQNKNFVNNYYREMTTIGKLRSKKELSALTNGNTVSLPLQKGKDQNNNDVKVAATFRYDDKGSQVICLYTTAGANKDNSQIMNHPYINLKEIILDTFYWKEGIKGGLKPGDIFKNVNSDGTYKVVNDNGTYKLIRINSVYKDISITPEDKNTAILYKVDPQKYEPRLIYPSMNY